MEWRTIGCVALTAAALECGAATPILGGNAQLTGLTRVTLEENGAHAARFASSAKTGVLDWSKFNVGTGQSMAFDGANTTFFNLVDGAAGKSQINGLIGGSGSVWVINPNGVAFGAGAQVNVGGLFAAAAGNIKNADALRAGTATTPEFSSFAGSVETAAGSRFTADQVALLGKTVSANGSFAAAKLDIGAAGRLTVDEVSGGRVSVNVADFADDPSEIGLVLGEIAVANSDGQTGDLKAVSDRGIEVAAGGSVQTFEGISLSTAEGDIHVGEGALVKGFGDVKLSSATIRGAHGDVVIDGVVGNYEGYFASVNVVAGSGADASGEIFLSGTGTVAGDYAVQLATRTGDVVVDGALQASSGNITVSTQTGDIAVGRDAEVNADAVGACVFLGTTKGSDATGDIIVKGAVKADAYVQLSTEAGGVFVEEGGSVSASGDGASVVVATAIKSGKAGDIVLSTGSEVSAASGGILVMAGCGADSSGSATLDGTIVAGNTVHVETRTGDVSIGGTVTAGKDAEVFTENGDIDISKGARVSSDGGLLSLASGFVENGSGNIVVNGNLAANGDSGHVQILSGYGNNAFGDISIGGMVTANGEDGHVYVKSGYGEGAIGDIFVSGKISAEDYVELNAHNGKVITGSGSNLVCTGPRSDDESTCVRISTVDSNGEGGGITINGIVQAMAAGGKVSIVSETKDGNRGFVSSGNGRGDITVNGTVKAEHTILLDAGFTEGTTGNVTVNGVVSAGREVNVDSGDGDVVVAAGGRVAATGTDGTVYLASGVCANQRGDVRVDGTVSATERVFLMAGVDNTASGNLRFGSAGTASSGDGVYVIVKGGGVAQTGAGVADAVDGYVDAASMHAAMSGKTVNVVVHGGSIGSGPYAYVAVDGKIYAKADGNISIAAANGGNLNGGPGVGTVSAGDLGVFTFGNPNGNSNMQAGGDLSVYTAGEIESRGLLQADGDVTASAARFGDVSFLRAGGRLAVNNVGRPSRPVVVYFTSVDGREPKILNQPNSTVIFVDGRLAGGNLQTLSRMGALEAFPVSTPELKSEQGVFGNPVFLHGDLDVANPMAVGSIDYMIQEIARLALPSDFPLDVEQSVDAAGLSPRDVYWFGQHRTVAMFR